MLLFIKLIHDLSTNDIIFKMLLEIVIEAG